jgi:calmodulin
MVDNLNLEKLAEYKAAFEVYEKKVDDYISTKELGTLLRSLGQNLQPEEVQELSKRVEMDATR